MNVSLNTGYRFNGEGYVEIDGKSYGVRKRSDIKLSFKTHAEDGLLFLAPGVKNTAKRDTSSGHFMSIEMKGGHIIFQVSSLMCDVIRIVLILL